MYNTRLVGDIYVYVRDRQWPEGVEREREREREGERERERERRECIPGQ